MTPEATGAHPPDDDAAVRAAGERAVRVAAALDEAGIGGRIDLLRGIADAIAAAAPDVAAVAVRETGLGHQRLLGEAGRSATQFRLMADVLAEGSLLDIAIDRAVADGRPGGPRPQLRRMSRPIGPVAVYAASNFPLAFGVAGTDVAAALAAGCPVIAKAHPYQPQTAALSAEIIRLAAVGHGLPADILQVVHGFDAGRALICDSAITAGAFTGSLAGGRALWDLACGRADPIAFFGELGSINPVVITPGAAAERGPALGAELAVSLMLGSGQFCTQPGLLLIPAGDDGAAIAAELGAFVAAQPAQLLLGTPLADEYRAGIDRLGRTSGARLLAAGLAPDPDEPREVQAQLWGLSARAALADPGTSLREIFGPAGLVIAYEHSGEAEDLLRTLPGCLSVSVHGTDDERALTSRLYRLAAERAGRVLGAGVPTGVAVSWAQHHGGPWPATTHAGHTSVGAGSIRRFLRAVVYQDVPHHALPPELQDHNPLGILRRVDGRLTAEPLA